jgi:hypothetical protein
MTNQKKFATGAFVFTRAKGLVPRFPEDIIPIAERHGIDPSVIPAYAGDRAAVGRAIARTDTVRSHLSQPVFLTFGSQFVVAIYLNSRDCDDGTQKSRRSQEALPGK